jgi:streptogramin lyase
MAAGSDRTLRVLISYRREDSIGIAGRIRDRLVQHYGADQVFFDIDTIPLGVDFRRQIDRMVAECDVVLVVIGRRWLDAVDEKGRRRLDHPSDFLRVEIESALRREIPVIPVLVDGADVPDEALLPQSLSELAYRNGTQVRYDPDFHPDMDRLIRNLADVAPAPAAVRAPLPGGVPPPEAAWPPPPLAGTGVAAPPPTVARPSDSQPVDRRRRASVIALAVVAGIALVAVTIAVLAGRGDDDAAGPTTLADSVAATTAPRVSDTSALSPSTTPAASVPGGAFGLAGGAAIPVEGGPIDLALDGDAVWVTVAEPPRVDRISVDGAVLQSISLPSTPGSFVQAAGELWVASPETNEVLRVNPANQDIRPIDIAAPPTNIAWHDGVGLILVTSTSADKLVRIDVATHEVREMSISQPVDVAVGHLGSVWVTKQLAGTVEGVFVDQMQPVSSFPAGASPGAITAAGAGFWIANAGDGSVTHLVAPDRLVETFPVGGAPTAIAADSGSVWVLDSAEGWLTRVDPTTGQVVGQMAIGQSPSRVAGANGSAWVTVTGEDRLVRVDVTG